MKKTRHLIGMTCLTIAGLLMLPSAIIDGSMFAYLATACYFTGAIIELIYWIRHWMNSKK